MDGSAESKLIIVNRETRLHRYTNNSCIDAANIFHGLEHKIGCTYLIYMYENLFTNEKFVYSSNWDWQDLLIGDKLINNCPIFLTAFKYLEKRTAGHIFLPWHLSPPSSKEERNVCGIRSEFNISNGFGYGAKGNGIRESLAFGGDSKDGSFYKHFISNPNLFYDILCKMRLGVLLKNHENKVISQLIKTSQ
jgi:hypothetical protein